MALIILKRLKQWLNKSFDIVECDPMFVSEKYKGILQEVNTIVNSNDSHISMLLLEQVGNALTSLGYTCNMINDRKPYENIIYFSVENIEHCSVVEYMLNYYRPIGVLIKIVKPIQEWKYGQWYIE